MLTDEEAEKIRNSLVGQLNAMSLSPEEMQTAKLQIESMPAEKLEEFVRSSCIFCSIAKDQIETFKIAENEDAVVVLEISPMSEGHSMLIPKNHVFSLAEFTPNSFSLLLSTIKKIDQELKPKQINITSSETSGHVIINILPLYGTETGKREKAERETLERLVKILSFEEKERKEEKKEKKKPKEKIEKPEVKEKISEPEIIIEQAPERIP